MQSHNRIREGQFAYSSTCIWTRCVSDRISVCGSDSRGRRARTIVNRKLCIRNRTRLSTAKRRLKKGEIVAVGMSQEAGDSASLWYLKSIPASCHKPWTTVDFHDLPYFFPFPRVSPFSNHSPISHANQTTLSKNVDRETKPSPRSQWTFAPEFPLASWNTIREKYTFTELWFRIDSALTDVWREQFFLFEVIDSVTSYRKYTLFNRF